MNYVNCLQYSFEWDTGIDYRHWFYFVLFNAWLRRAIRLNLKTTKEQNIQKSIPSLMIYNAITKYIDTIKLIIYYI